MLDSLLNFYNELTNKISCSSMLIIYINTYIPIIIKYSEILINIFFFLISYIIISL